jgi:hypothetical protein
MSCGDDHKVFVGVDLEGENHGLVEYTIQAFLFRE